ncbi:MAG: hypothetical protein REI95_01040 [Oxalicibacterium faecigallinarum]|uniref:Uncharacterized protein n=1 Tax=Oxalicibacterium faecigallinarum TaxID=573741 RepID=A0A8J3F292_9BURK|nr:hypothetical protein [Oxalicibacterium faecigallinarum]MDQ7968201.1 hypothetical protein [Oxalicibacterium faecigallinarum]GGI20832.1 hypothetical protein GCM10008066_26000 [Oxalicibacterium faecigallinarum]
MSKTNHELTHRILSMSSQAEEKHHGDNDRETVAETQEAADKRESHIHVVPFNPVQTGSFQ